MSLRTRLLLGTGLIALVLVASAVVIARTTRAHLTDQIDVQLREAVPQLRGPAGPDGDAAPRFSTLYVAVLDRRGVLTTVYLPDLRGGTAPTPEVDLREVARLRRGEPVTASSTGDSRYRLVARGQGPEGRLLVLGLALDDVDDAVRRLVAVEALAVLVILAVLGLVTWWVVRLGVRPVRRMTETAEAIAAGDLSRRVPEGTAGTEAGDLGTALNGMLARIETAFDEKAATETRLRRFVADASHELRTPVTTIRGYAELYRAGALRDGAELGEAMRRTEQEAVRMGTLVDGLIRLARLDEGQAPRTADLDLTALAADAVRDALAREPGRSVSLEAAGPVPVRGDEDELRQVVGNLVANALVHAPGARVTVRVHEDGDLSVLEVADDGPGMADEDAARAFERFYRADASRSRHRGGSGLGLSIVDATVRAHGGTSSITSAPGAGTTVRVALPRRHL